MDGLGFAVGIKDIAGPKSESPGGFQSVWRNGVTINIRGKLLEE